MGLGAAYSGGRARPGAHSLGSRRRLSAEPRKRAGDPRAARTEARRRRSEGCEDDLRDAPHLAPRPAGCWVAAAGPYPARLGKNGPSANRREGDGTTPTGTFRIGRTMYGNDPNPGVRFRYRRLRCGDLVGRGSVLADLQLVPARPLRDETAVRRRQRGDVGAAHGRIPSWRWSSSTRAPPSPGRGSGIFLHAPDRRPDDRLRQPAQGRNSAQCCAGWEPDAASLIAIGTRRSSFTASASRLRSSTSRPTRFASACVTPGR